MSLKFKTPASQAPITQQREDDTLENAMKEIATTYPSGVQTVVNASKSGKILYTLFVFCLKDGKWESCTTSTISLFDAVRKFLDNSDDPRLKTLRAKFQEEARDALIASQKEMEDLKSALKNTSKTLREAEIGIGRKKKVEPAYTLVCDECGYTIELDDQEDPEEWAANIENTTCESDHTVSKKKRSAFKK